jgi:hypothetical protein
VAATWWCGWNYCSLDGHWLKFEWCMEPWWDPASTCNSIHLRHAIMLDVVWSNFLHIYMYCHGLLFAQSLTNWVDPGVENSTSPTSGATIFNCRTTKFCHKKSLTDLSVYKIYPPINFTYINEMMTFLRNSKFTMINIAIIITITNQNRFLLWSDISIFRTIHYLGKGISVLINCVIPTLVSDTLTS